MDVIIQEVSTTVRAVDGDGLLDARTLERIVRAVVAALEAERRREDRREADSRTDTPSPGRSR